MSNNYTQFAECLLMPPAAARYAVALSLLLDEIGDQGRDESEGPYEFPAAIPTNFGTVSVTETLQADARSILGAYPDDWFGSSCDAFDAGPDHLYVSAGEVGDVEAVALIVQATLRRFVITKPVSLEFAYTSSALRAGEFGGGAIVIEANALHWLHTTTWVDEKLKELTGEPK